MRRWVLRIFIVVSLLLALASAGLWVYGLAHYGTLRFYVRNHLVMLAVFEHSVFISTANADAVPDAPKPPRRPWVFVPEQWGNSFLRPKVQVIATEHRFLGFGFGFPESEHGRLRDIRQRALLQVKIYESMLASAPTTQIAANLAAVRPLTVLNNVHRIAFPLWFTTILFGLIPAETAEGFIATPTIYSRALPILRLRLASQHGTLPRMRNANPGAG